MCILIAMKFASLILGWLGWGRLGVEPAQREGGYPN